jgi:hypothetical protein
LRCQALGRDSRYGRASRLGLPIGYLSVSSFKQRWESDGGEGVKIVKSAPSNDDVEAATEQHEHVEVQMACIVLGVEAVDAHRRTL